MKTILPPLLLFFWVCASACTDRAPLEEGEAFPGGETTNTLLFGSNAYSRHVENIENDNELLFFSGNSFFNQAWVTAPASTQNRDGLGPLFNAHSCSACHFRDGRAEPPLPGDSFDGLLLRIRTDQGDDPHYGGQIQNRSINGITSEGEPAIRFENLEGSYDDGRPYTLQKPFYSVDNPQYGDFAEGIVFSPRIAPAMIGLGLLEAIPEDDLLDAADPSDDDNDGISGEAAQVLNLLSDTMVMGRFGWKAEQPTVRQQSAGAFLGDIGITTSLFPNQNCSIVQTDCQAARSGDSDEEGTELRDDLLDRVTAYSSLLAVPARHTFDDAQTLRGKLLFESAGCIACHTPRFVTGESEFPELEGQVIWPYTDLLLHDMGEDLSDDEGAQSGEIGREWKTPPLWGLSYLQDVSGHTRLLHDGRARNIEEAILWHGGEAQDAQDLFRSWPLVDRQALIHFVGSL